jgi:gluconokinase
MFLMSTESWTSFKNLFIIIMVADTSELGIEEISRIYQLTGAPIHSAYALAQMRVFYNQPNNDNLQALYTWKTIATICLSNWTGENHLPISYSEASWTGLLNFETCKYEPSIVTLLPPLCRDHLPNLADFDELSLQLEKNGKYWTRWPKLQNTRFFLGVGDGACANVGSRCTAVDQIACTVGTSAAARVCLELPIREEATENFSFEPGLFCYRINRTHVLVGGALTDGGSVIEWVRQLLRLSSNSDFQSVMVDVKDLVETDYIKSKSIDTKSRTNLTVVPFLSGERSTGFRSGATGSVIGITRDTNSIQLVKACLESVILRLSCIIELLHATVLKQQQDTSCGPTGRQKMKLICSGKALEENMIWRQMLADCEDTDVYMDVADATSRGVAILVLISLRFFDYSFYFREYSTTVVSETDNNQIIQITKSNATRVEVASYWSRARQVQESLIHSLTPLYDA